MISKNRYLMLLLGCLGLLGLGCHTVPPYHEPMGYSSTYVKALKTGPQGHAIPLRSSISRVKPVKHRVSKNELLDDVQAKADHSDLAPQDCPPLPPAILPDLPTNPAHPSGVIN